jgi:hypothetical protein
MRTPVARRLVVGLAAPVVLVLGLAACGSDDVSKETFQSDLEDEAELSEAQASCMVDYLYDELDQDQINELYADEELSAEVDEASTAAVEECAAAG